MAILVLVAPRLLLATSYRHPNEPTGSEKLEGDEHVVVWNHYTTRFEEYEDLIRDLKELEGLEGLERLEGIEREMGRICRVFRVIFYPEEIAPAFQFEHGQVLGGKEFDDVFYGNDWMIGKRFQYFGELEVGPDAVRLVELMKLQPPVRVAVKVHVMTVDKDNEEFDYLTVVSVYHPDYETYSSLVATHGSHVRGRLQLDESTRRILEVVQAKMRGPS